MSRLSKAKKSLKYAELEKGSTYHNLNKVVGTACTGIYAAKSIGAYGRGNEALRYNLLVMIKGGCPCLD